MAFQSLISEFETKLEGLEFRYIDILYKAEHGIIYTEKYIKNLWEQVGPNGFLSVEEEIFFFKHIKSQFFSKLIYYV